MIPGELHRQLMPHLWEYFLDLRHHLSVKRHIHMNRSFEPSNARIRL